MGATVVSVHNLDICDGLNNGTKGIVIEVIRSMDKVTNDIVESENKEAGKSLRQHDQQRDTCNCLYKNGTPILTKKFTCSTV